MAVKKTLPVLTIGKVKTWDGREGLGSRCTVYLDGKPAGEMLNEGNGGEPMIYGDRTAILAALTAYAKTIPPLHFGGSEVATDHSWEMAAAYLVDLYEENKTFKALLNFEWVRPHGD